MQKLAATMPKLWVGCCSGAQNAEESDYRRDASKSGAWRKTTELNI